MVVNLSRIISLCVFKVSGSELFGIRRKSKSKAEFKKKKKDDKLPVNFSEC